MYNVFSRVSKKSPKIVYKNKRKKDISISISDVSKLNREISINHKENKWLDLAKTSIELYRNK